MLAACDAESPTNEADAPTGVAIACATGGADAFAGDCTVRRTTRGGRAVLTLIAPDGGFRRLEARADGTGIDTADGASHARNVAGPSGEIEVAVDKDRYRLPATSTPAPATPAG